MRKKLFAITLAIVFAFGTIGAIAADKVDTMSFSVSSIVMAVGEKYNVSVTSTPARNASSFTWTSDDTRVATVSGGVIVAHRNGGCIITAKDPDGTAYASLYVGVGAPYGYNYYYPYSSYSYNYYYDYYDYYGYYPYSTAYPSYNSNHPYFYDYYNNYYYPNYYNNGSTSYNYGQPVYSVNKPNPVSYVSPGTAVSATQLALEFKQGVVVSVDGDQKGFGYVTANNYLVVTPDYSSTSKANTLQFPGNILNRLTRFNLKAVRYVLPKLEVYLHPELNRNGETKLDVSGVKDSSINALWGPWKIDINSEAEGLSYRFVLDKNYGAANMSVVRLKSNGTYEEIDRDLWKLMRTTVVDDSVYSIYTEKLPAGTYAVVKR